MMVVIVYEYRMFQIVAHTKHYYPNVCVCICNRNSPWGKFNLC